MRSKGLKTEKEKYSAFIDTQTAVQVASFITAYARSYMYKFKNLENNECFYTDTDSLFLEKKLNDEYIGNELGEFKLEYKVKKGYFIAPKVYYLI